MLARLSALRAVPRMAFVPVRYTSSQVEGSVAQSKGFSKKEKAHEDEYAHRHEMELLKKMRDEIAKKKVELEDLQKREDELTKKNNQ
ncbi:hypothetical protein H0H93_013949 [Arthromyces matolae]|nr:hypothetical protein H0H93_013949 [Arthromyces matolae]